MGEVQTEFVIGVTDDGNIVVQFTRPVPHLTLTTTEALEMAEGLAEAARMAAQGRILRVGEG